MDNIVNMFYGLDTSVENNEFKYPNYKNNSTRTPALNQGMNFEKYQNKIKNKDIFLKDFYTIEQAHFWLYPQCTFQFLYHF